MPKVLIVYGPKSKTVRRWVIPDHEWELADPSHLQPGEAGLVIDVADPLAMSHADMVGHVARHHGLDLASIVSTRCHVVHVATGTVVATIHADAEIDSIAGHLLVPAIG